MPAGLNRKQWISGWLEAPSLGRFSLFFTKYDYPAAVVRKRETEMPVFDEMSVPSAFWFSSIESLERAARTWGYRS